MGDKIDSADKAKIEAELEQTKKALESNNLDEIKAATEKLTQVTYDVLANVDQQQAEANAAPGGDPQGGAGSSGDDDNVVDADYEVMDDDKII